MNIGDRVGAVLSASEDTVNLLGYGVYDGDHVPDEEPFHSLGITNPKITLDNGNVVWGYQCWWGPEDRVKNEMIGDRKVVEATID